MSEKKFSPGTMRSLSGFPRALAYVCGASLTLVTFYTAFRGVFLPLVLKGCVDWAKENGVELITEEHMKIINDKRSKEKNKK